MDVRSEQSINVSVSAGRLHKRRQRARTRERKQMLLDELIERIPKSNCDNDNDDYYSQLFKPIPSLHSKMITDDHNLDSSKEFWKQVPNSCNPNQAIYNADLAPDAAKLSRDKKYQARYQRKLNHQVKQGDISQEQKQALWESRGRASTSVSASSSPNEDPFGTPSNNESSNNLDADGVTLLSAQRGQRKAWQVENLATLLAEPLLSMAEKRNQIQRPVTVVDFGCGSGNLCLALAAYFRHVRFVLVDKKSYPLQLVQRRAQQAGLTNVKVLQYTFAPDNLQDFFKANDDEEDAQGLFDIGIGLHCCGSFTDMVMELCLHRGADCIVCPCCNGGMTANATCGYAYPRSNFLKEYLTQDEYLGQLSKGADDLSNYAAKCLIEYDRAMWAKEHGFREVELWKMTPLECTPKHHVLYLKQ